MVASDATICLPLMNRYPELAISLYKGLEPRQMMKVSQLLHVYWRQPNRGSALVLLKIDFSYFVDCRSSFWLSLLGPLCGEFQQVRTGSSAPTFAYLKEHVDTTLPFVHRGLLSSSSSDTKSMLWLRFAFNFRVFRNFSNPVHFAVCVWIAVGEKSTH